MSISIPSLIPLANGATVLRADLVRQHGTTEVRGVVMAMTSLTEYVTWRVSRRHGEDTYQAESGCYYGPPNSKNAQDAFEQAVANYDRRRGVTVVA